MYIDIVGPSYKDDNSPIRQWVVMISLIVCLTRVMVPNIPRVLWEVFISDAFVALLINNTLHTIRGAIYYYRWRIPFGFLIKVNYINPLKSQN